MSTVQSRLGALEKALQPDAPRAFSHYQLVLLADYRRAHGSRPAEPASIVGEPEAVIVEGEPTAGGLIEWTVRAARARELAATMGVAPTAAPSSAT